MATPTGINEADKENQQSPMPSEEQKTTETVQQAEDQKSQTPVKDESGLPDTASERTRREFEKLQDKLREERTRREYFEGVFNSMNTPKAEPEIPVYDPNTGLINETALEQSRRESREAKERAARAELAVQNYLYQQEERDAYSTHPELKDEGFKAQAEGIMYHSQVNPDRYGKQFNLNEAATYLKGLTKKQTEKVTAEAQKDALERIEPKEQASLAAEGGNVRTTDTGDAELEDLRYRSRRGDQHALAQRLHRVPPTKE